MAVIDSDINSYNAELILYKSWNPKGFNQFELIIRDAPFDIWGGGARVFVACKLFFLPPVVNKLFLAINVRQFFFYVSSKNFFVVCFPYYVRYYLVFFLVNIFFINFDNKLFFSAHIFNKLFFLTFVATDYVMGLRPV